MKLDSRRLIKEYYNSIKDLYPNLTEEECREIVSTPFKMVREDMEGLGLSTCRLKYFGTFLVYPKKAVIGLKNLTRLHGEGKIQEEEFLKIKKRIEEYVRV